MAIVGTCVVAVAAFLVVAAVPSARVRRDYVDGYLFDTEDASIAGDHVGVGLDCSDDSSESIEAVPAYIIINKREAAEDPFSRSSPMTRMTGSAANPADISFRPVAQQ